ncbi:MAG TPA: zinc-ribbon domain-containing protein, partial [Myxococcota bacterium]
MECPSCGASDQHKARCEACGFAFPQAVAATDDALSLFLGLVCIVCDTYNDPGTEVCVSCGSPLEPSHEEPELPASLSSSDVPEAIAAPPALVSSATLTPVVVPSNDTAPFAPAPAPSTLSTPLPPPPASSPSSTGSGPVPVLAAPPSWMSAPTGQPLSTHLAMKKVDLASISTVPAASLAAPEPTTPPHATSRPPMPAASTTTSPPRPLMATATAGLCFRCQAPLEPGDRFCRNCGARVDGGDKPSSSTTSTSTSTSTSSSIAPALSLPSLGAGPAATQVISALKLPNLAPAQSVSSATSTMVMPAMKLASSAPAPTPAP